MHTTSARKAYKRAHYKRSKELSVETATIVEMLGTLPLDKRKYVTEKLRDIVSEEIDEQKWDETFHVQQNAMIKMAQQARKEHRKGKSKQMEI